MKAFSRAARSVWPDSSAWQWAMPVEMMLKPARVSAVLAAATCGSVNPSVVGACFVATTWLLTGMSMGNELVATVGVLIAGEGQYLALTLTHRFVTKRLTTLGVPARTVIHLLVWVLGSALVAIPLIALTGMPVVLALPIGIQCALVVAVIALAAGYRVAGQQLQQQLAEHNSNLKRQLVENTTALRGFRERLRHYIHGDLQSVFIALERKLVASAGFSAAQTRTLIDELETVVTNIARRVEEDQPIDVFDTARDLQAVWGELLTIELEVSPEVRAALAQSSVTSSVLSEVLIEAVTNAAKHDSADSVAVRFALADPQTVGFTCHSLVTKAAPTKLRKQAAIRAQGQGTKLFSEVCLDWQLTLQPEGSTLTAHVPLVRNDEV